MLIALLSVSSLKAEEKGKHLFILSGQSNMGGLKPEVSFTPAVETAFGKDKVVVVKDAQGSQPIRRWYKKWKPAQGTEPKANGELYDRLMEKVNTAIKGEKPATVTFVWMQGEADAKAKNGDVYSVSLRGLVDQLASDMGRTNINFVIGRLSDCGMSNTAYPHWTLVREAQVAVAEADPRGAWVNTDDLNDKKNTDGSVKNELHYTDEGYKILGQRFAEKAIALISKKSDKLNK
jgi:hypothetical protein